MRALELSLILIAGNSCCPGAFAAPAQPHCPRLFSFLATRDGANPLAAHAIPEARARFVLSAFANGDNEYGAADVFARHLRELPVAERAEWIRTIYENYRQIPKKPTDRHAPARIGGRRLLDRVLMLTERNDLRFTKLAESIGPDAAFRTYLDEQAARFGSGYSSAEVIDVINVLQGYLKEFSLAQKGGPPPSFVLSGSFLNGRARLQISDLDLSISHREMLLDLKKISARVNEHLKKKFPDANLQIEEAHTEPEGFYGGLNTLALRITPEESSLSVFPPSHSVRGDSLYPGNPRKFPLHLGAD